MAQRKIIIAGIEVQISRTNIPVRQPAAGKPFLRKACTHRKYITASIGGATIGTMFSSVREAAKAIASAE